MSEPPGTPDLKLVELYAHNVQDIPACLEACAARLRDGGYGDIVAGAMVLLARDGEVITFGYGDTSDVHSVGMFTLAANWLSTGKVSRG